MPDRLIGLDLETLHDALGPRPSAHDLAMLRWDLAPVLAEVEREIANGSITSGARMVRGRPLGDWLDLDECVRLFQAWSARTRSRPAPPADPDADLRRALEAEAAPDHGLIVADLPRTTARPRATHGTPSRRRRSA